MSVRTSGKKKRQSPQRRPATYGLDIETVPIPPELLINDVVVKDVDKFNAEADRRHQAAAKRGFTGVILPGGRVGKLSESQ